MNKDDYQNKIEEYRKPIQINGEEHKPKTRSSRHTNTSAPKKPKKKRNILLPILFFFFILIPVSFLIYVFAFYEPNANETAVYDNSELQYEQNNEESSSDTANENTETEENTNSETSEAPTESTETEEQPVTEEKPVEKEPMEEPAVDESQKEQPEEQPEEQPVVTEPSSGKTHVVQPGETLYRIAMNYYKSADAIEDIKASNGLSSNEISTGQTLILP